MPRFSDLSLERLDTCDQRLQDIFHTIIKHYDCKILEGHRSIERQRELVAKGASKTMNSNHLLHPSRAVDVVPWPVPLNFGGITARDRKGIDLQWKERVKFYQLAAIVLFVAAQEGTEIVFGGDWDRDRDYTDQTFDDLVHYQLKT